MNPLKNQGFLVRRKSERFPSVSIIIPAHNEEKRIEKTLLDYIIFFSKKYKKDFEIIVVLNGCTDNTEKVVKKIKRRFGQIRYLNFKQSGKGFAVIEGFKSAKGKLIGFADADDATMANEFYKLIEGIDRYDGIIASRWAKGSVIQPKQPLKRQISGRIFNLLIRLMFHMSYKDTQCGAKLFKSEALKTILPNLGITEWAFDVDLLYNAERNHLRIMEIPTVWHDMGGSKIKYLKSSLQMIIAISRLRMVYSPFEFIVRFYDMLPEKIKLKNIIK